MTSSNTHGRGQAVTSAARTTQNETLTAAGRAGFVARGVVYVLIGALALQIALSSSDGESADRQGALAQVAGQPFGKVMLWAMVVGFASMALWRGTRAVLTRGPQRKAGSRVLDGGRAVFYAFVCWTTAVYAAGGAFRSVVLGLLGVVLNLLSAAAALGLLVLVFQGTWVRGCWTSTPRDRSDRVSRSSSS
ncbi:protein of unknown function [Streptomyces sp. PAN_FS17]|nr:protein of unknown function [Streptomyces sp. PAN_FS17]